MTQKSGEARQYVRPTQKSRLTPQEKSELLIGHINHYTEIARSNPAALNTKIPRGACDDLLDRIGRLLLQEASRAANNPGPINDFLENNPLPESMRNRLLREFRAFCLAINALKQWVAAEQAATDRYLLGGTARARCKALATTCVVTGEALDLEEVELHHPVRDGRPPIPLSKVGHATIENQQVRVNQMVTSVVAAQPSNVEGLGAAPARESIEAAVRKVQGHASWLMLRRACLEYSGRSVKHSTPQVGASSRAFARKAIKTTGLTAVQLLEWLDESGLGV